MINGEDQKVIYRDGKVVIVKQGISLREFTRMHITRLQGKLEGKVDEGEDEAGRTVEEEEEEEPESVW